MYTPPRLRRLERGGWEGGVAKSLVNATIVASSISIGLEYSPERRVLWNDMLQTASYYNDEIRLVLKLVPPLPSPPLHHVHTVPPHVPRRYRRRPPPPSELCRVAPVGEEPGRCPTGRRGQRRRQRSGRSGSRVEEGAAAAAAGVAAAAGGGAN